MLNQEIERYSFYKLEGMLSEDKVKFLNLLDETLQVKGVDHVIGLLKTSGLPVNMFDSIEHQKLFDEVLSHVKSNVKSEELQKIKKLQEEAKFLEQLFQMLFKQRDNFFNEHEPIKDEYKVVSFLISLEIFLSFLIGKDIKEQEKLIFIPEDTSLDFAQKSAIFDSTVAATGTILNYFMFRKYTFKEHNKNLSPKILKASSYHLFFSEHYNMLNEILEYWRYSEVNISVNTENNITIEILNEDFELNNLVSNERFYNLRNTWQATAAGEINLNLPKDANNALIDKLYRDKKSTLGYLATSQYFGSPQLDVVIKGITLKNWVRSYELLIEESEKFINKKQRLDIYNLSKICLIKPMKSWISFFENNGFSKKDSKTIIKMLTFDRNCSDLVDCPFVKFEDNLAIIPSLTSSADVARALASNFLNRGINLGFKGPGFEERMKKNLDMCGIKNSNLYKKVAGEEYECDIAFVLEDNLFLVECKAHVQPHTTRQHTDHLNKLYKETSQLNRIADFYKENLDIVKQQMNIDMSLDSNKVHRILLTTSMIGRPLFVNGVYIVDESSFTTFIKRNPPSTHIFEKRKHAIIPSTKFEIYKGKIDATKMITFLKYPPQIKITTDCFKTKILSFNLFNLKRNVKVVNTFRFDKDFTNREQTIMDRYF
ncbi:hypothetical protein P4388_07800 [Bacillus thuringiensis]|uniref:hypothetical protein n=1 Tax=Bacillus thuringiensis TaxID=1428 RepID=UPI000A362411|nr:hypothetical protein [Bacillus thuringiensis]MED3348554.1 hypothetical protein [Bacillus thuringiensis]MRB07809.1 hypothetical protein [Bacillus thuringiensis]OTW90328.1 hypothetical protein BK710_06500 [Bacillus thuringiensis serovar sumiyoshiensis]OTW96894.1 hypothetical protein BK711_18490 [Bacillus thuringiensis serovar fukuokaensis]PEB13585.1 hypothetical protein COM67_05750 [Bacillus thuringiensis]